MKLIAIRHGEAEWNIQGREMGQLDSPLTLRGGEQARAIARRLKTAPFDLIYTSDLGRAVQTAEIIAAACRKEILIDTGLRERHMGIFQGLTIAEMRDKFPKEREDYERIGFEYIIPGGESAKQRLERSVRVLTAIAERHAEETVVVITHGGFLMGFFEFVLGIQPGNGHRFKRCNGSYNVFQYSEGQWCLEVWNDISHIEHLGTLDDQTVQASE